MPTPLSDPRIKQVIQRHDALDKSDPIFKTQASKWRVGSKIGAAILSVLTAGVVAPLALWLNGAFTRRLHVMQQSDDGPARRVNTRLTQADWSKVVAVASGSTGPAAAGREERLDAQVRSFSLRILKSATNPQSMQRLNPLFKDMSTQDLANVARLVAAGQTGVIDSLEGAQRVLNQDTVSYDSFQTISDYKSKAQEVEGRFRPGSVVSEAIPQGPTEASALAVEKQLAIRALMADLLFAEDSSSMSQFADQGGRVREVLARNIDTLALIAREPETALDSLPGGLGDGLKNQLLSSEVFKLLQRNLPQDGLTAQHKALVREALDKIPNSALHALHEDISNRVDAFDFNRAGLDQLSGIDFSSAGEGMSAYLGRVFKEYFNNQAPMDKRAMAASLLRNSTSSDDRNKQLVALLKGCGPYLLKLLQLVGDNAPTPELRDNLGKLKSELTPLDPIVRKALLNKVMDDINANPQSKVTIEAMESVRSLGAASVGETVSATVLLKPKDGASETEKQRLVIKLLRPGIELRAARDREFFMRLANDVGQGMPKTIEGIARQIDDELDLRNEAANIRLAQTYNKRMDPMVQAMRQAPINAIDRQYLALQRAPGSTVKQYIDLLSTFERKPNFDPLVIGPKLAKALANLSQVWFDEAFFESGVYHGDLHSGNLMFNADEPVLTMIDFGNASTLSSSERRAILSLGVAADRRYPSIFIKEFVRLLSPETRDRLNEVIHNANAPEQTRRELFAQKVTEIIVAKPAGKSQDVAHKIQSILSAASTLGIEVPAVIANYARSMLMLTETINQVNQLNEQNVKNAKLQFDGELTQEHKRHMAADQALHAQLNLVTTPVSSTWTQEKIFEIMSGKARFDVEDTESVSVEELLEIFSARKFSYQGQQEYADLVDFGQADEKSIGYRKFVEIFAPAELKELDAAKASLRTRMRIIEEAEKHESSEMFDGAEAAGNRHFIKARAMMIGNYWDFAFTQKAAQTTDAEPAHQSNALPAVASENSQDVGVNQDAMEQDVAEMLDQFVKGQRNDPEVNVVNALASYDAQGVPHQSSDLSMGALIQARRNSVGPLISQ